MLTQESFKQLLQKIVGKHLPEESIVFEIQADSIIEDVFNNKNDSLKISQGDKFGAIDLPSTKIVIELAVIAIASYKTILEIIKLKKEAKEINLETCREKWELRLKNSGIKSPKAKAIAEDFIKDLEKIIK